MGDISKNVTITLTPTQAAALHMLLAINLNNTDEGTQRERNAWAQTDAKLQKARGVG